MIKTKLSEKDFINLNFVLLYKKIYIKYFYAILIIGFSTSIFWKQYLEKDAYSKFLLPIIILLILHFATYFGAKKNYTSNARIKENIEYSFERDYLIIEGESFKSKFSWDKIYKVTQTKNWILIWQNRNVANCIPKMNLLESEEDNLKIILSRFNIKNNL